MKVVASKSFFGSGVNARKGDVIEVADKLGKSWLKSGLVTEAGKDAEVKVTVATTSPRPASKPSDEGKTETTGEVVDENKKDAEAGNQPKDGDQTTLDEVKDEKADTTVVKSADKPTETEKVETNPTETVTPPVANSNQNAKKGGK